MMELEDNFEERDNNVVEIENESFGVDRDNADDFYFETIDGVPSIKISDHKQAELAKRWNWLIVLVF